MKAVDSCELFVPRHLTNYLILEVVFQLFLLFFFFSYFDSHYMMYMYISLHFVMKTCKQKS